jgi:DNA-binding SARP family transcriptional activator
VLEFRILGPLEVATDRRRVRLGGRRQRATLAILLLDANRVVPVERLADELYAGRPPATAVTQVQRQVSELRTALGSAAAIETRPPGYLLPLAPGQLDLSRFESLTERAAGTAHGEAATLLREALALWRGPALADLAYEPFARAAVERLEELRIVAVEARIEADLALGRHAALVAELDALVREHPLRERLHGQRMLALYRSHRQAEALDAYRATHRLLADGFGLEPSEPLRRLQRAMLARDPALELATARPPALRAVVAAPTSDDAAARLAEAARPLVRSGAHGLLLVRIVQAEEELEAASAVVRAQGGEARTAAFTSRDPTGDLARLAAANECDLILVDGPADIDGVELPQALARLLERSPTHVAVLVGGRPDPAHGVFVPFGGGEHDWAALELGAWLASSTAAPLRLVGTRADERGGRRDASRLLADASLAVQRLVAVDAAPVLADPDALVDAVSGAGVVVVGISPRWRHEGIGESRRVLVRAGPPVLLVHRGPRPGALAPPESRTRFTWTIGA